MSPQISYTRDMPVAVAGMQVDGRHDNFVASAAAEEVMPFGCLGVRKAADAQVCRLPGANVVVVTDDAGTWTAGDVVVTINGQTVTVSFSADKATSMAAIATALQALAFVTTAAYVANDITITADADVYLSVAFNVAGITGTMTISGYVHTSTDSVIGLTTRDVRSYGAERNMGNDVAVATLAGDALNTSDTVTGTVNGVAIATVTYGTSEAATLQVLVNTILEIAGVTACSLLGRVITITNNPGLEIQVALTVTDNALASVAPSFSYTYSKQSIGVTLLEVAYLPTETAGLTRRGSVYMKAEEALVLGDSIFVRVATGTGSQRGSIRNDIDSGSCQAYSNLSLAGPTVSDPDGNLVAPVEINLP